MKYLIYLILLPLLSYSNTVANKYKKDIKNCIVGTKSTLYTDQEFEYMLLIFKEKNDIYINLLNNEYKEKLTKCMLKVNNKYE